MNKNILDLINDKETIVSLFKKIDPLYSENKLQNKKIKNIFLILLLICFIFFYISQSFIFKEEIENSIDVSIALIFSSAILTTLTNLLMVVIYTKFEEDYYIKNLDINIMYKKKFKNKILKFEKNLTKKELEYYNCIDFKDKVSDYEYFLYNNYIIFLNQTDPSLIIENKTIIFDKIKEEFNKTMQQHLFIEVLKIIREKDEKDVLDRIDIEIRNWDTNKIEMKIENI